MPIPFLFAEREKEKAGLRPPLLVSFDLLTAYQKTPFSLLLQR